MIKEEAQDSKMLGCLDQKRLIKEDAIRIEGWKVYSESARKRYLFTEPDYVEYFRKHKATEEELKEQRKHCFALMPKISIIVPTYRTPKKYLVDMIESVIRQSYPNWELCIADGSEGDHRVEGILQKYHAKDQRISFGL